MLNKAQRDRIIIQNINLARNYVSKHLKHVTSDYSEEQDLIQVACEGLIEAVACYKPSKGKLSTIAHYKMRTACNKYIRNVAKERGYVNHSGKLIKKYDVESLNSLECDIL